MSGVDKSLHRGCNEAPSSDTSRKGYIVGPEDWVLVTGANGFVGSRVVHTLLSYGFKHIRCLIRSTSQSGKLAAIAMEFDHACVEIISGNLLSHDDCKRATKHVAVVYHLAAGVEKSFPGCFLNSVVTTRNLLNAVVEESMIKRFVNVSSIAVYTNEAISRGGLLDETCTVDTKFVERHEPYSYGKAKQDDMVLDYARTQNVPYVIVRPGVVFGPGKAKITDRIGTSIFGVFLHLGLGNRIPLTYVDNCAEAIVLAGLQKGIEGEVFNIVDDDVPTSKEFLTLYKCRVKRFFSMPVPYPIWLLFCWSWERYCKWSDGQMPPVFNIKTCAIYWKGNTYSNRKAKKLLGWQPKLPMKAALESFFAYLRERDNLR